MCLSAGISAGLWLASGTGWAWAAAIAGGVLGVALVGFPLNLVLGRVSASRVARLYSRAAALQTGFDSLVIHGRDADAVALMIPDRLLSRTRTRMRALVIAEPIGRPEGAEEGSGASCDLVFDHVFEFCQWV